MLAQNYMTAEDLKITEVERQSLIKVLGMLVRVELVHGECPLSARKRAANEFNMAATLMTGEDCGTIGCMAGWAYTISNRAAFPEIVTGEIKSWRGRSRQLVDLFGIGKSNGSLYDIKPARAALALRSYLTTGDARWDLALA